MILLVSIHNDAMSVVYLQKQLPHLIWMDTPVKHRAEAKVTGKTPLGSHCKPLTVRVTPLMVPDLYTCAVVHISVSHRNYLLDIALSVHPVHVLLSRLAAIAAGYCSRRIYLLLV